MMARVQRMGYVGCKMRSQAPAASLDFSLFLDVDGTLVELQETPAEVVVGTPLKALLTEVSRRLGRAARRELLRPLARPRARDIEGIRRLSSGHAARGQGARARPAFSAC